MKQTKKMTRNQREFLQHTSDYKEHAKEHNNSITDYRVIEDTKDYLKVIDNNGNKLIVKK